MPTTQRLLTDTTGQALVTAVNNIVAAVKPNATEIQMSSSDTTTVATAITNINNKIGTVPSGQTVEDQITTLNSNKANYLFIDATSYTHDSKTGWDFAYGKIPDGYNGILKINFSGGYNVICTTYRQSSNWGSIIGHENSNHIPFFYNVQAGTSTLDELALNSNVANAILLGVGNLHTADGFSSTIPYPTGMSKTSTAIVGLMVFHNNTTWRYGEGINRAGTRLFASCETDGIRVYNDDPSLYGLQFRVLVSSLIGKNQYNG